MHRSYDSYQEPTHAATSNTSRRRLQQPMRRRGYQSCWGSKRSLARCRDGPPLPPPDCRPILHGPRTATASVSRTARTRHSLGPNPEALPQKLPLSPRPLCQLHDSTAAHQSLRRTCTVHPHRRSMGSRPTWPSRLAHGRRVGLISIVPLWTYTSTCIGSYKGSMCLAAPCLRES